MATNDAVNLAIFSTVTFLIFLGAQNLELQLKKRNVTVNHKLIFQVRFNIVWVVANFIIFWSAGIIHAKTQSEFLTFDEGKTVVIYVGADKIFTTPIIDNKIANIEVFSIVSLNNMNYHFKTITIKR
ncbi:hypothetical protein [Agriterribacter sp.]|mgnify:CR=1 FL=1|uniref:hypothetical protein n=1 Tax=Agriterribacter sp. TaxID=2821509 RepID=UPI002CD4E9F4|nr:hypothetical protein [Agriterribacter sp.]HRO44653.1 hypothetical protein [Agriterribacter sp.]HRQ16090.1 hypothetical protein [Agriterribacter sp.]